MQIIHVLEKAGIAHTVAASPSSTTESRWTRCASGSANRSLGGGSQSPGGVESDVDESLRFVGQDVILIISPHRVRKIGQHRYMV